MKTRIAVITLAVLIAANLGFSNEPEKRFSTLEKRIDYAVKNYARALKSDNEGLVQSGIIMIAKMKLTVPSAEVGNLKETLDEISVTHPSAAIRYKAYIVSNILDNPEWYKNIEYTGNDTEFFISASSRLQEKLFGFNTL